MRHPGRWLPVLASLVLLVSPAPAQEAEAPAEPPSVKVQGTPGTGGARKGEARAAAGVGRSSLLGLIKGANFMIWPLGVCSIVALGYALERLIALRRDRVVPREFVTRFLERLASGKLDRERAAELCRANDSPVARVFGHVIRHWGQPAAVIRQAIGYDAAGELVDLKRNVRVLNGTATLAPLLGLLGTVFGMIEAFDALGGHTAAGSAKSEALAHGISLALLTTAFGLAIAVVSVAVYYFLLNRVDVLVRELDEQSGRVIDLVAGEGGRSYAERRVHSGPGDIVRHTRTEPV